MAKSSSINSPFSDAVVTHNEGKRSGSDRARAPKNVEESELYHPSGPHKFGVDKSKSAEACCEGHSRRDQ